MTAEKEALQARMANQQHEVQQQKECYPQLWCLSCKQLDSFDKALEEKSVPVETLLERIALLEAGMRPSAAPAPLPTVLTPPTKTSLAGAGSRRG